MCAYGYMTEKGYGTCRMRLRVYAWVVLYDREGLGYVQDEP